MALTANILMPQMTKGIGPVVLNEWKGDNSTVYVAGMLLRKSTAGTMLPVLAGASYSTGNPTTTVGIHAIYAGPTRTAATADFIPIREITTDTRFEAQLWHATPASAIQAQGLLGGVYNSIISAVGDATLYRWMADMEEQAAPDVQVTGIWDNSFDYASSNDESGVYGIVEVMIVPERINALADAS